MAKIKINHIEMNVPDGITILSAAKSHNINIPTLCFYPDLNIKSDCRVCSVELVGQKALVTACSTLVKDGMEIKTNSPRTLNARKTILEMILANHDANCTACVRNMKCELQKLANTLGVDENRFDNILVTKPTDDHNPAIVRNPNRCIKCGRCIDVCKNVQGIAVLDTMGRGHDADIVPAFHDELDSTDCTYCGQCSSVCPVGAISEKDHTTRVWHALHDENKHLIVQAAPAVRVSLGEEFGMSPGSIVTGKMVAALKLLGFNRVFDTNFTADLTIIEEGNELIHRIKHGGVLPMITSCCPGWINYTEKHYPEIIDHLSTCKSPQQMFGALAKTYYAKRENIDPKNIYVVSVMPCTAKKFEAQREEMKINGIDYDVDAVLTTRELAKMIKQMGIDFTTLKEEKFDRPDEMTSGAAAIFGATGGVMEAALRTVYEVLNEKPLVSLDFESVRGYDYFKEASVDIQGQTVKVAVVHTLKLAKQIAEDIKHNRSPYAFIEVMACPGGCVGGGGEPYGTTKEISKDRNYAIYQVDRLSKIRKSHENPAISTLYSTFLGEPYGPLSHELLHTHYIDKKNQ